MRAVALGLFIPLGFLGSCLSPPAFPCNGDSVCVLNNVQGMCDVATQTCVYIGPECPSGYRDGHGDCVDGPIGMSTTVGTGTDNSGDSMSSTMSASSITPDPGSSSTSSDDESSTSIDPTDDATTTGDGEMCAGKTNNITDAGVVGASTVFSGYPPILSVDGDLATSWFSTGPEGDNDPSVYTWTLAEERCIARIFLSGNGLHSNPTFREDFGFDSVVVRVFNIANEVVFEESRELPNSPDPDVTVMTGGVLGSRVVLEFDGHESPDCGGFSELQVLGE